MSAGRRQALFVWLALLLLLAVAEIGGSFVHFDRSLRPVLLLPALAMVAVVGLMFMRVQHSIAPARGSAIAGLLWLLLLLGLGMMDPLTRAIYPDGPQTTALR
jgi:cytochrome c oxidase subunit 4